EQVLAISLFQGTAQKCSGGTQVEDVSLQYLSEGRVIHQLPVGATAKHKITFPIFGKRYKGERGKSIRHLRQGNIHSLRLEHVQKKCPERIVPNTAQKNALAAQFGYGAGHVCRSSA